MALSRATLVSQARFNQRLLTWGRPLTFAFAGPWTRDPATGLVSRAPLGPNGGAAQGRGILSLGGVASDLKREKVDKWGESFQPDGDLLFSASLPSAPQTAAALLSVTDAADPDGPVVYDVIYVPPSAFVEDVGRIAWVRRQSVYNKLVTVRIEDETNAVSLLVMASMPCRLTPIEGGTDGADSDYGGVLTESLLLEFPFVWAGAGTAGTGVSPVPAGSPITLVPKRTFLLDPSVLDPATGSPLKYRVDSVAMDAGGDAHHQKATVSLA